MLEIFLLLASHEGSLYNFAYPPKGGYDFIFRSLLWLISVASYFSSNAHVTNSSFAFPLSVCTISFVVNNSIATIKVLTKSNYKRWKQDIDFVGIVHIDLALRVDKPNDLFG